MIRITIILLLTISSVVTWAQTTTPAAVVLTPAQKLQRKLDTAFFKAAMNREFSRVVSGEGVPGNYASFNVVNAELNGSGSLRVWKKKTDIITFGLKGGITEGLTSMFTDSKVNPNVSFEVAYNFLNWEKRSITVWEEEDEAIRRKIEKLNDKFATDNSQAEFRLRVYTVLDSMLKDSLNNMTGYIGDATTRIKGLQKPGLTAKEYTELQKLRKKLTELIDQNSKLLHLRDSVKRTLVHPVSSVQANNERILKTRALIERIPVKAARFGWWSVGYKLLNRNFFLFDSAKTKTFAQQVEEKNFTTHQITVAYNKINWNNRPIGSYYFSMGMSFLLQDNFHTLKKTEITDTYTYAGSPKARSEQKKYTVFRGEYEQDVRAMRPFLNLYYFPMRSQTFALHLNPEVLFTRGSKPLTNFETGLLIVFIDKNDKTAKAKVNAELYVKFNDLYNNLGVKGYDFHERNDIGIRLTFPFRFLGQ